LDPHFHILAEVERQYAEKEMVKDFRKGSEVKIELGKKKPVHTQYRF